MATNDYGPSLKLARLYEKTSKSGNTYMTGRLGGLKVAMLKSREVADDGGAIWEIILSQAPDKAVIYSPAEKPVQAEYQAPVRNFADRNGDDPDLIPF